MDIQFLQLTRNQLNQLSQSNNTFQVGKILNAIVGQNKEGFTLLLGQNKEVPIKTDLPLTKGETLSLKVTDLGDSIILKLQSAPQKLQTTEPNAQQQLIQNTMKQAIPKQESFAPLLANLKKIADVDPALFKESLKQLSNNLIQNLPTVKQTSDPQGLKEAIKNSGIFLEAKLAKASQEKGEPAPQLKGDLKANLLKLYSALAQHIPKKANDAIKQQTIPTSPLKADPKQHQPIEPKQQGKQELLQNMTKTIQTIIHHSQGKASHQPLPAQTQQPPTAQPSTQTHSTAQQATTPHHPVQQQNNQLFYPQQSAQIPFPAKGQFPSPQKAQGPSIDVTHVEQAQQKLSTQVEASLSRMHLNQVASLPQPGGEISNATWLLDVPIRSESRTDIMQMAIEERDPRDPDDPENSKQWQINLALDLENVGPLQASIQLYGKKIQVSVWSEDPDSHYLINSELNDLRKELEKHEFEVEQLQSFQGLNETIENKNTLHLVDEKI